MWSKWIIIYIVEFDKWVLKNRIDRKKEKKKRSHQSD